MWFRFYNLWATPQVDGESRTWILSTPSFPLSPSRCSCKITPFNWCTQFRCPCADRHNGWGTWSCHHGPGASSLWPYGTPCNQPFLILFRGSLTVPALCWILSALTVSPESILTLPSWGYNPSSLSVLGDSLLQTSVHRPTSFFLCTSAHWMSTNQHSPNGLGQLASSKISALTHHNVESPGRQNNPRVILPRCLSYNARLSCSYPFMHLVLPTVPTQNPVDVWYSIQAVGLETMDFNKKKSILHKGLCSL